MPAPLPCPGRPSSVGLLLASFCSLAGVRTAQAGERLDLKAQSWQEDGERIRVDSQYALAEAELSPAARLKLMGLIDTIAGATPTGERPASPDAPVPTADIDDRRTAWNADFSYQFPRVNVALGHGVSRESDYVSKGYSLNTQIDFNEKNTTLLLGWGHTDDRLMARFWSADREKTGDDVIIGLTQLLSPLCSVTANLSLGHASGFLSDPYKIVSTTRLDLDPGTYYTPPENRPGEKDKVSVFLGANRRFERADAALEGAYRFYHDSFGVDSHTVELRWLQRLGPRWLLEPAFRYHRQSEADFYHPDLDAAGVVTSYDPTLETGTGRAPHYSSDHRLSRLETYTVGLKAGYAFSSAVSVNLAYDRYLMRGLDSDTPRDAYSDADVLTIGLSLSR